MIAATRVPGHTSTETEGGNNNVRLPVLAWRRTLFVPSPFPFSDGSEVQFSSYVKGGAPQSLRNSRTGSYPAESSVSFAEEFAARPIQTTSHPPKVTPRCGRSDPAQRRRDLLLEFRTIEIVTDLPFVVPGLS